MRVALVHDDLIQQGGAEKLFETIAEIFPEAPIYTSLVDKQCLSMHRDSTLRVTSGQARTNLEFSRINTSFIQKIPFAKNLYKVLLPLYPFAFENFNFDKYDVVISSTTRFTKAIITKPKTVHICYINSVTRFLWDQEAQEQYLPYILRIIFKPYFAWLKKWDRVTSARPDFYIANSNNVKEQVKKIYGRKSQVIYPFIDTEFFVPAKAARQDYFLIVTRLVKWKKIEIAIQSATMLKNKLVIVGDGPDKMRLMSIAKGDPNVFFAGEVSSEQLRLYLQFAKGFIVTQNEDFGISMVEAQSCGTPVIAYKKGGQKEIILEGKTGIFFANQTASSLEDALKRFSRVKWTKEACRKNSLRFTKERFVNELKTQVLEHAKQ